jgi:hypothetical protein
MFRKIGLLVPLLLALLAACSQTPTPEVDAPAELAPMFGSTSRDEARGLAQHSSRVYVVGTVGPNIFIRKSGASGNVLWDKYIFGSARASGVASDPSNNAYVLGIDYANDYRGAILIRKYTPDGGVAWTRRLSTNYSYVSANGIAADGGGNVYLLGYRNGAHFLSKYSTGGTRVWTRHGIGGSDVAVDLGGNIYVAGYTSGVVGDGSNMSIRKFSPSGGLLWTQQVLYKGGYGTAVAVSGNHVYLVGNYVWNESHDMKVAVTKYNPDGVRQWSRPYGLYGSDYDWDASADEGGNLYFAGYRFGGPHSSYVGYVAKFSPDFYGRELWTKYISAPIGVYNFAVLARTVKGGVIGPATKVVEPGLIFSATEVYAAGYTFGDLGAGYKGGGDAYLRRFNGSDGSTVWTK